MAGRQYAVKHLELDGEPIDREDAYPSVHFKMEPIGRALPETQQVPRLKIVIGNASVAASMTILDHDSIDELYRWLGSHDCPRGV